MRVKPLLAALLLCAAVTAPARAQDVAPITPGNASDVRLVAVIRGVTAAFDVDTDITTRPYWLERSAYGTHVTLRDGAPGGVGATLAAADTGAPLVDALAAGGRVLLADAAHVRLWDVSGPVPFVLAEGALGGVAALALSSDGARFAVLSGAGINRALRVWDLRSPYPAVTLQLADETPAFSFSPDGRLLLLGGVPRLLDSATGDLWTIPGGYTGAAVQWNIGGTHLALVTDGFTLVFAVPSNTEPEWYLLGTVLPSGINVRAAPNRDADVLGTVSGQVRAGGRSGDYVYLPDAGGWALGTAAYISFGAFTLDDLPPIAP